MKLPLHFAAAAPKRPENRCSSCRKRGFVREKGSIIRKCLYCGSTEAAALRPAPAHQPTPRPAPVTVRFAWEPAA